MKKISSKTPRIQNFPWVKTLKTDVDGYLRSLQVEGRVGQYKACLDGAASEGKQAKLGFSCFALKTVYGLGLWDDMSGDHREMWIDFIQSFQRPEGYRGIPFSSCGYIDPMMMDYLIAMESPLQATWRKYFSKKYSKAVEQTLIAEHKQAWVTLHEVGARAIHQYEDFPKTKEALIEHLGRLDWTKPWGAGGQASALAVFITLGDEKASMKDNKTALKNTYDVFVQGLAHEESGAYYLGEKPAHKQLINGSMKMLTGLHWLQIPIHYPEKLIDTCLSGMPQPNGCHLVDVVYVLYRCMRQTQHRKEEMRQYCLAILGMIQDHRHEDGGFSYYVGKTRTQYYGVPISEGLNESDIHGTCLLVWAVVMICEILDCNDQGWRVMKP